MYLNVILESLRRFIVRKKYKVIAEIELEINATNKKQIDSLIEHFKNSFMSGYENFGSAGTIKTTNISVKDICENRYETKELCYL